VKTVAVLGGGPAGAFAAERLAQAGLNTRLFDEKLAWEKPCGGGITYKAYHQYPFLMENGTPKRLVRQTVLSAPNAGEARMDLSHPLVIYSRNDLNRMLLERAAAAGAALEKTRVMGIEASENGWRIRTQHGVADADFCVLATGARNPLRAVGTEFTASDTMSALGYYVPGTQEHIDIEFLPRLEGYIWVFPRCGHLSVGICGKGEPAQSLRKRLDAFMDQRSMERREAVFYSHMLPSLEGAAWRKNRVAGRRWLAVGDAAGLVDPITGEGLFYAMRSGELASHVILGAGCPVLDKAAEYRAALARDFTEDLTFAAMLAKRIFQGRFLFGGVPRRMVQFARRSARFRDVMQDLIAGTQPYLSLRARLLANLNGTLQEVMMSFFLERVIPGNSRAIP
jgi:geranylgeranyl reductase family protein